MKRSVEGEVLVNFIKYLHEDLKLRLEQSNHKHKDNVDEFRRHVFEVGDEVMVHLKKGRFIVGIYSKLKMKNFGPCMIFRKFDSVNAY